MLGCQTIGHTLPHLLASQAPCSSEKRPWVPTDIVAFLVAFRQNKQLIGDSGLLPCRLYLRSVQQHFQGRAGWDAVSYAPTLIWLLDWSHMDANLDAIALLGLGVSSFVLVTGCANMVLMAALWVLYMSLVNVGQVWRNHYQLVPGVTDRASPAGQ
ncbi:hypothetical protein HPG69_008418 [Diceros bicornis minor]|uniref:Uncharacterized protein n=1 Tax=Diceros bicornis minor TaxID=77932 RepID=A0A7J7FGV5_DICBM|nr:hypothetical protein HPG69_008418 [Diceros bicornis minor]